MRKSKTVLVTGGAGFVGGHLVEALLAHGYRVVCLDLFTYAGSLEHLAPAMASARHHLADRVWRPELLADEDLRLIIVRGDINDSAVTASLLAGCDGILALAAETHVDYSYQTPGTFVRANIEGTHRLLEVLRTAGQGKRLLHVSTDEVCGERRKGRTTESAALRPRNIYAATKACGEILVRAYADVFGLDVVMVRPCNLIGPRQQPKDLIPKTFSYLLQGRKMTIHGNGRHVRGYLYVRDAVEQMIAVYERGASGETYNLSSLGGRTTLQVVRSVARSLRLPPAQVMTFVPDRPNPDRRYASDQRKIRKLLGRAWRPTPFRDVIACMRDDFTQRQPQPLP